MKVRKVIAFVTIVMMIALAPAFAFAEGSDGGETHFIAIASDRHATDIDEETHISSSDAIASDGQGRGRGSDLRQNIGSEETYCR